MQQLQQNESYNDRVSLRLFRISYVLFLTYSLVGHISMFTTPLKLGTYIGIFLLIINFFVQYNKADAKSFFGYLALMVFSLVHAYFSGNYSLFKLAIFAGSIRRIRFKDVIKLDMWLRGILIVFVAILCEIGIAEDMVFQYNEYTRRSMGFTNPNTLGIAVFIFVCDVLYVCDMKPNWKQLLLVVGSTVWLYAMARSRTAVMAMCFIIAIAVVYKWRSKWFRNAVVKFIFKYTPIFLAIVTLIVTVGYSNGYGWADEINDWVSNRIDAISDFAAVLKPTLFGQPIHETMDRSMDNTYGFVFYALGLGVFALYMVWHINTIKRNFNRDMPICIIMFVFAVYGLSEHLWFYVDYNIFMLALCYNPIKRVLEQSDEEEETLAELPQYGLY